MTLQISISSPMLLVIPNGAESPVRACPGLAEGNLLSAGSAHGVREVLLRLHHGKEEPGDLRRHDGIPDGASTAAPGRRRWSVYAEVSGASAGILQVGLRWRQSDRTGNRNQEVATREERGVDRERESDMGRPGRWLGRAGGDDRDGASRFPPRASAPL